MSSSACAAGWLARILQVEGFHPRELRRPAGVRSLPSCPHCNRSVSRSDFAEVQPDVLHGNAPSISEVRGRIVGVARAECQASLRPRLQAPTERAASRRSLTAGSRAASAVAARGPASRAAAVSPSVASPARPEASARDGHLIHQVAVQQDLQIGRVALGQLQHQVLGSILAALAPSTSTSAARTAAPGSDRSRRKDRRP